MEDLRALPEEAINFRSPNTHVEDPDATSELLQDAKSDPLPSNWTDQVIHWKPGKEAPSGTYIQYGTLVVKDTEIPSSEPEASPKPIVKTEEPSVIDTSFIATLPDDLPPGGLRLYTDFVKGAPNPNLVNYPLEEQILKRASSEPASLSFASRIRDRLGTVISRFSSQTQESNYEPYPGD